MGDGWFLCSCTAVWLAFIIHPHKKTKLISLYSCVAISTGIFFLLLYAKIYCCLFVGQTLFAILSITDIFCIFNGNELHNGYLIYAFPQFQLNHSGFLLSTLLFGAQREWTYNYFYYYSVFVLDLDYAYKHDNLILRRCFIVILCAVSISVSVLNLFLCFVFIIINIFLLRRHLLIFSNGH